MDWHWTDYFIYGQGGDVADQRFEKMSVRNAQIKRLKMELLKLLDITLIMYTLAMLAQRIRNRRGW